MVLLNTKGTSKIREEFRMADRDLENEGRQKVFMDLDRIRNEGLAGGTVAGELDKAQMEEAIEFHQEEPPVQVEKNKQNG
jgi:hypothetical protein